MKKLLTRGMVSLCTMTMVFCMLTLPAQANTLFTQPELMLVEESQEGIAQHSVDVAFDNANTLHSVWADTPSGITNPWIYGAWLFDNGFVHVPYRGYHGSDSYDYYLPFIERTSNFTDKMYVFGLEDNGSANLNGVVAEWDLTQLPSEPGVSDITEEMLAPNAISLREMIDVIAYGDYLLYAYEYYPDIYLKRYNINSNTWDTLEEIIAAPINTLYSNPRLAVDDDNYVYLSYDVFTTPSTYELVVRRSTAPEIIDDFTVELTVNGTASDYLNADLAVSGPAAAPYVALSYVDREMTMAELHCTMQVRTDWTSSWSGGVYGIASRNLSDVIRGPVLAFDADGQTLYATWVDNSTLVDEVYAAVSYDGGVSFQPDQKLTDNGQTIVDGPRIATGTNPGVVAIAYTRNSGTNTSPFVLYSIPEFFDKCDTDPANYWDSYGGVSLHYTGSVIPLSPPACYRMATASARGQLLNDYGSLEHTGSVTLNFYDDDTITGSSDYFYVALENANSRGVIRMLGVRNDTTQSNYSYSTDGTNWVDSGIPRYTGWHSLSMITDTSSGLTMNIDNSATPITDPTFTTFTRITIEGGTDTDPYYVDNIQVSSVPQIENHAVPVTSPVSLTLLLATMGYAVLRRRKQ